MPTWSYTLFSELNPPSSLVRQAEAAEGAGFDRLAISDHIHPWLDSHSDPRSRGACSARSPTARAAWS